MDAPDWYRWEDGDLILHIRIQPRASHDAFAGTHGDRLKLRITAPPVDGAANEHMLQFLAGAFGVARRDVTLVRGERGKSKTVRIHHPRQVPPGAAITSPRDVAPPLR